MTEPVIFLRTVVPMIVMIVCVVALSLLRERIKPPERGFLIWFWGCLALVFLEAAVVSLFLRLAEPEAMAAGNAGFNAVLGIVALALLAVTVALARWVRVMGRPMLGVLFRPPRDITYRALHGWPFVPVITLYFAIGIGAFSGTYALTSWLLLLTGR